MNILIVSHRFAPDPSPRAFRWATLAQAWAEEGHEVSVLTSAKPGLPQDETDRGVRILRTGPAWRVKAGQVGGNPIKKVARSLYRKFLRPQQWPDYAASWLKSAEGRVASLSQPDLMITVSHPHSSHVVGLASRRTFSAVRWIVDIGDPFSFLTETPMNDLSRFGERNVRSEAEVLAAADAVAVTCEPCRQEYALRFPESAEKLKVIGPMLPPIVFPPRRRSADPKRVDWVFAGRFYPKIRTPDGLLRLFAAVRQSDSARTHSLHLFGDANGFEDLVESPPPGVFWNGMVSREIAMQALADADLLVHLGNTTVYQLPSKAVEYAMALRPILNISPHERDLSAEFFRPLPWAISANASASGYPEKMATALLDFLASPQSQPDSDAAREFLAPYSVESVKRSYEELF